MSQKETVKGVLSVIDVLSKLTEDDIKSVLKTDMPGIKPKTDEAFDELVKVYSAIPILRFCIGRAISASHLKDPKLERAYRTIVNLLVMIYKKEQQNFIDKIMTK